jgi:hypothetical protein
MMQYYVQADGIPQYIVMMEDAQKKAKRAGMPIANVELVMMALVAVLLAQHFPCKVDDWESLVASAGTWSAWKTAFRLVRIECQHQILARGSLGPPSPPLQPSIKLTWLSTTWFADSCRVLTTAMDDWSENLFALAPVGAYAYV